MLGIAALAVGVEARADDGSATRSVTSTIDVHTDDGVVTVHTVNRSFALAGPGLEGREASEHLLLSVAVEITEVLGEKGVDGRVSVSAWPLDEAHDTSPSLYSIAVSGQSGAVADGDLFVIERGLEETAWQSVHALSDGARLFDATTPWLRGFSGGLWDQRRYVALVQVFDDAEDVALRDEANVALLTFAARDRVLGQVVIRATDPERARFLKSVVDQEVTIGWLAGAEGKPLPPGAAPDPIADQLSVLVRFRPDGATVRVPLGDKGFDAANAIVPEGLMVEAYPPNLLLGRWTVADAKPAPWLEAGTDISATVAAFQGKSVEIAADRATSETPLACAGAGYASAMVPPNGLFQGGLAGADAEAKAKSLGLSGGETRSVTLSCDSGVYDFHFPNRDTALLAFDNVIVTLSRAN